jgi:hypothetical protein
MPRYYFSLTSGGRDDEGADLPDDDAARHEAILVACDFARNSPKRTGQVIVIGEDGAVVHEIDLTIARLLM